MGGAFWTHFSLGDTFERQAPALVFGLLLVCRLIIYFQVVAREKKDEEFFRKMYKESIRINDSTASRVIDDEEENTMDLRKQGDHGVTNKKNVTKQSDREEKKIKWAIVFFLILTVCIV